MIRLCSRQSQKSIEKSKDLKLLAEDNSVRQQLRRLPRNATKSAQLTLFENIQPASSWSKLRPLSNQPQLLSLLKFTKAPRPSKALQGSCF